MVRSNVHLKQSMANTLRGEYKGPFVLKNVFVWYAVDFINLSKDIQHAMKLVTDFTFVLYRDHPVNQDGAQFAQLSLEPVIQELVSLSRERQKNNQLTHQQQPQKPADV